MSVFYRLDSIGLVLGIVLIVISIILKIRLLKKISVCCNEVQAVVVDSKRVQAAIPCLGRQTIRYRIVYYFVLGNKGYCVSSSVSPESKCKSIGSMKTLFVSDNGKLFLESIDTDVFLIKFLLIIGILSLILSATSFCL